MPVMALLPLADRLPSLTLVAMVKLALKSAVGVKVRPASSAFTSASAPLALHTPLPVL